MPILNKKQLKIAIPCWLALAIFGYLGPVHNLMNMPPDMLSDDQLRIYTNFDNDTIVVYPIFTQFAYSQHGFYEYYKHTCDQQCLTVTMYKNGTNYEKLQSESGLDYWIHPQEETSNTAFVILTKLNYHWITDIDIDKNPKILDRYTKVILLHNEYMTEKEAKALKDKKVLYLYPNAMYAEVKVDYDSNTMTLVKGHGYQNVSNAFDSGTHSQGEYNLHCSNSTWYKLQNGMEYSCYPELDLLNNKTLLTTIREWPANTSFNMTKT